MPATVLDLGPLTAPISRREVADWRAGAIASGAPWARSHPALVIATIASLVVASILGLAVTGFASLLVGPAVRGNPVALAGIAFLVLFSALVVLAVRRGVSAFHRPWRRWAILARTAERNGLRFSPHDADPVYPGMLFGSGSARHATEHVTSTQGRFVDLGGYSWTTGSDDSRRVHSWGYLALRLDRALPHMVLDASRNNPLLGSDLPESFDRAQILHLEGDFDRHFTLYCPREYERDALQVFTPDLMALLIDEASAYDVEIVDDWMFVYAPTPFDLAQPAVWRRLFRILDTVGAKTLRQTERYRDDRADAADGAVAPAGTRLRRRVPVAAIVVLVLFAALWAIGPVQEFVGLFAR